MVSTHCQRSPPPSHGDFCFQQSFSQIVREQSGSCEFQPFQNATFSKRKSSLVPITVSASHSRLRGELVGELVCSSTLAITFSEAYRTLVSALFEQIRMRTSWRTAQLKCWGWSLGMRFCGFAWCAVPHAPGCTVLFYHAYLPSR